MNKMTIIGNLTRDPVGGTTPSGVNYCKFTVAVNRRARGSAGPDADFIQVTAWRGLGDSCQQYLRKGSKVAVVGRASSHGWVGNDNHVNSGIDLDAEDVEFLTPRGDAAAAEGSEPQQDASGGAAADNPDVAW